MDIFDPKERERICPFIIWIWQGRLIKSINHQILRRQPYRISNRPYVRRSSLHANKAAYYPAQTWVLWDARS